RTEQLRTVIESVHGRERRGVPVKHDPETGKHVLDVTIWDHIDPEWGVTVGEIVHDLRSALDALVYQLALLNGTTDAKFASSKACFPIFLTPEGFATRSKRTLQVLRTEHQTLFEKYQPYRGFGPRSVLWCLHEVNNTDKHRLLLVVKPHVHRYSLHFHNRVT